MTAVASLVVGLATVLAAVWIGRTHPASRPVWPLVLPLATTVVVSALARARGRAPSAVALGVALVACAILGTVGMELPLHASALAAGDSPASAWMYAVAGVALVTFVCTNPLRLSDAELVVLVLVVFAAGNGKVWTRTNADFFPLYVGLATLALFATPARARLASPTARAFVPVALAFAGWLALTGLSGEDPGRTDEVLGRMLAGIVAGWAAARTLDRAGVERALYAAALCGLAAWTAVPVAIDAARVLSVDTLLAGTRLRLFGLHPNLTGTFLAVQLVLAVGLIADVRGWRRAPLVLAALACAPALFQTRSRTAWIAALAGLGVLALARRLSRRVWLALIGLGVLAFAAVLFVGPLREAALRPSTSGSSLSQRIFLWDASARLVAENPLTGIGANNYFAHERAARTPSFFDNTNKALHPHNLFLAVAAGSGLVGLALFLLLLGCAVVLIVRALAGDRNAADPARAGPRCGAVLLAAMTTLVLANMFDLGLSQVTFVPTLFWLLAGMAIALDSEPAQTRATAPGRPPFARAVLAVAFLLLFGVRPFVGERLYRTGIRHESASDPEQALAAWDRARLLLPWTTDPVIRSARLCESSGRRTRALEEYERVVELAPTAPRFRHRFALFLTSVGETERAIEQGERTLELSPRSPEEATYRTLLAENLARAGRREEAREELGRALLAKSRVPERFEAAGWTVPVEGGEPIDLGDLAVELSRTLVTELPEREDWDVRRRGDRLGRILLQLGRTEAALAMLEALEDALEVPDPSLRRLHALVLQELGRLVPTELEAFVEAERSDADIGKSLMGFTEERDPKAVIAKCEQDLRVPLDLYFNVGAFRPVFEELLRAAVTTGDIERAEQALEGLLFLSEGAERAAVLTEYADLLVRRSERDQALDAIRRALEAADEIEHPPSRVQVAYALSNTALAAARAPSPQRVLQRIERATSAASDGPSHALFWILCHLGLAPADPALGVRARQLFDELRDRYPREGEPLAAYFEQAGG